MTSAWWTSRSIMAAATMSSPKTSPQRPNGLLSDDQRGAFVAGRHELEEQVGGLGLKRDVADLVDHQQRVAAKADQLWLQPSLGVGVGQAGDPLGRGGEQHPMAGLAGPDAQPDGQVGLAGPWWAEEDHILPCGDEVQRAEVGDLVAFQGSGVVIVELLQRLAGREACLADAALAAVGLSGGDLALQAGGQELLVGPALGAGAFGQAAGGLPQAGGLERAGEEGELGGQIPTPGGGLGWHQATPWASSRPKTVS